MIPRLEINFTFTEQCLFLFGKPYAPDNSEFLLNHSRSAIVLALRALRLPKGSGIGVMVINCHTVMNAVEQAGYVPVFLDVTDKLTLDFDDLRRKASGLSALIVTHLFGILNDIKRIKTDYPDLVIIEDCAHAYGISSQYSDFSTYSIGQGKMPSIGDGGILKVRNSNYLNEVARLFQSLPDYSLYHQAKLFLKLLVKSVLYSPYLYGWLTLPIKRTRIVSSGRERIVLKKMSTGISAIYAQKKCSLPHYISRRKENTQKVVLSLPKGVTRYMIGHNAFMLVLYCENIESVRLFFLENGIETGTHFSYSLLWAREFGYKSGQCANAEKILNHLLMVPTFVQL